MSISKNSIYHLQTVLLALYALSLYFPAFNSHLHQPSAIPGYQVLASGWIGIFFLDPRWLANVLFAFCLLGNFSELGHRITPTLGILLVVSCIVFPIRMGYQDRIVEIDSRALGFYFWSISLFFTFLISLHLKKDSDDGAESSAID